MVATHATPVPAVQRSAIARSVPFAFALIMPTMSVVAMAGGGWFYLLPPTFLFVITPLLDLALGVETRELEDERAASLRRDMRYDVWLWAWIPVQIGIQIAAVAKAASAGPQELLGLICASGLVGGVGINVAHELMHRRGRPERAAAELLMTSVSYTHFCVEHVLGHHKNVATPLDPASAQRGELVYGFVVRSILCGVRSAWRLERSRVEKLGITPFSLRDRRARYALTFFACVAAAYLAAGAFGVVAFLGQSLIAVLLLEVINYLEHYGLSRTEVKPGTYQRVTPEHSWSSPHRLTNWYLFQLPRHADHHAHASRPYFALRHVADGPQLPAGYATMLLLALVPPLWRRVMDPRVDAWNEKSRSRVHAPTRG